jgi:hypothetical protein
MAFRLLLGKGEVLRKWGYYRYGWNSGLVDVVANRVGIMEGSRGPYGFSVDPSTATILLSNKEV